MRPAFLDGTRALEEQGKIAALSRTPQKQD